MRNGNNSSGRSAAASTGIYPERMTPGKDATRKDNWIRVTMLGCCREVGRAAFLLSTPNSKVLIDCGEKPVQPERDSLPLCPRDPPACRAGMQSYSRTPISTTVH